MPDIQQVAKAIADKYKIRIQPYGAYSANLLGISEQVPAKVIFLTDGNHLRIKYGTQEIVFKRTTPKNMATAGKLGGLVIQALRFLGKNRIDEKTLSVLRSRLTEADRKRLHHDLPYATGWIARIMKRLSSEKD